MCILPDDAASDIELQLSANASEARFRAVAYIRSKSVRYIRLSLVVAKLGVS